MTASDENAIPTETLTADDIVGLNRQAVVRAAAFTRLVGSALVIAGAIAMVAWLWLAVRQQQLADADTFSAPLASYRDDVSFAQRIDLLASQATLAVWAVLAVGVGLGLRLGADDAVARTGGTLTGFEPGDRV